MGGNALPQVPTQRLDAAQFHAVAEKVIGGLRETFGARAEAIPAYRTKETFGDLDVVVEQEKVLSEGDGHAALREFAVANGFARAFKSNGGILSYDHRDSEDETVGFQVDLILTPAAEFDITLAYFSFNDLGNLIGRTAHKMGFTYGHRGLIYPYRDGNHLFRTLDVSSDLDAALTFLGYAPERFRKGFEDLPEIFDYVTGSAYFNPAIYLLENRNHAARVRDRKRKTYMGFLEHLRQRDDWPSFEYPEDKSVWLPKAFERFPNFHQDYLEAGEDLQNARYARSVFNGELVGQWTGRTGKDLGRLMTAVREGFDSKSEWMDFLRSSTPESLRAHVLTVERLGAKGKPTPGALRR